MATNTTRTRLKITGPHRESGSVKGGGFEYGYGAYWHAVAADDDLMEPIWAWSMTPHGVDLGPAGRRRLLARARYARKVEGF